MEGETIMMQDLFEFVRTETAADGAVIGQFRPTGIRSAYAHQIEVAGFKLEAAAATGARRVR